MQTIDKQQKYCYNTNEYFKYSLLHSVAVSPKGGVKMRKYEIMFIVRPDMEETEIQKTAETLKKVLTDQKSTMVEEKAMGPRELAYEIKKFKTGYYYLFVVEATPEAVAEFDRVVRINENLLRHLIVNVED